jgi:DNA repair exonuclease SbcCD ATPase subunit
MPDAQQDPRERAIAEKARIVMDAKRQLDARAQQVAAREATLAQREHAVQSREAALASQPRPQATDALSQAREASSAKREKELQEREGAAAAREAALKDEEAKLEAYRNELIGSAQTLVQKEEELARREPEMKAGMDSLRNIDALKAQAEAFARALAEKERELASRAAPLEVGERELQEREMKLAAREEQIVGVDEHMKDRALELQKLGADLNRWKKDLQALADSRSEIERRQAEQAEKDKNLAARERALNDRDASLRAFEKKVSDGDRTLSSRRAEVERTLQDGREELARKSEEVAALNKKLRSSLEALHPDLERMAQAPRAAQKESEAVRSAGEQLERERARSRELEARLAEEARRFSELRKEYDAHRQKVNAMEQSLSKAEKELSEYEKREGDRVRELESAREDLLQKARMLMEQEEELKRQEVQMRAAGPGGPPTEAQEALDKRAAALDEQAAMIRKLTGELDQRAAKLKEAAQMVASRETELADRESALAQASQPSTFTIEPSQEPQAPAEGRGAGAQAESGRPPEVPSGEPGAITEAEVRERLAQADGLLAEAKDAGGDVSQLSGQFAAARDVLDQGRTQEADAAVRASIDTARSLRDEARSRRKSEFIESAQKLIAENKQLGIQVAEAEGLLDKALSALQSAQTDIAQKYAQEAQEKARAAGDNYNQATQSMQRLDAVYREAQTKKPDIDMRDITAIWGEASAAFDKGDYATAADKARKAERKLHELEIAQSAMKAAAPKPPPSKYQCPSCGKIFQVVPPAFRPFDVGCPHCHTVVRISK